MARILQCWEIGDGLGYMEGLCAGAPLYRTAGHEVGMALRDLTQANRLLRDEYPLYQAPIRLRAVAQPIRRPATFADQLHNMGYGNAQTFLGMVRAWRSILDAFEPDILRCLHSPGALLAARGLGIRTLVAGTGFLIPPPVSPLPNLRSWEPDTEAKARQAREQAVLAEMNAVLAALGAPKLDYLAQLYETDAQEIYSFPELDEYPQRKGGNYFGMFQIRMPNKPRWPTAGTKRLYAHLEITQSLPGVLEVLKQSGCSVIAFVPRLAPEARKRFAAGNLVFAERPLDLIDTAKACDLAVNHGGHNIAATVMLAGKPQLLLPRSLPERITSENVAKLGAGIASATAEDAVRQNLAILLGNEGYARQASAFAARHKDYSPEGAVRKTLASVTALEQKGLKRHRAA